MAREPEPARSPSRLVAVSTALFDGYSMGTAVEEIAAGGAAAVEPAYIKGYVDFDETAFGDGAASRLSRLVTDAGLGIVAVSAHMDLGLREAGEMLARRIAFAGMLGARFLITNTGAVTAVHDIVSVLEGVQKACEAAGVCLALENPGHGGGDLLGTGSEGRAFLDTLDLPHLCLNYDVGNVFTFSREAIRPEQDIAGAVARIGHVHLKDVLADRQGWTFTAIGDGSIDYPSLWKLLPEDIPVAIELPLRLDRSGRMDPVRRRERTDMASIRRAMRRSLDRVRQLDLPA